MKTNIYNYSIMLQIRNSCLFTRIYQHLPWFPHRISRKKPRNNLHFEFRSPVHKKNAWRVL